MISFFFNDTATTEIYTLSLHDALPICRDRAAEIRRAIDRAEEGDRGDGPRRQGEGQQQRDGGAAADAGQDRKSTRLNSSHANISYAVFCLKKKHRKLTRLNSSKANISY